MTNPIYPLIFKTLPEAETWGSFSNLKPNTPIGKLILFSDFKNIKINNGPLKNSIFSRVKKIWGDKLLGQQFKDYTDTPLPLNIEIILTSKISPIWLFNKNTFWHIINSSYNSYFFSNHTQAANQETEINKQKLKFEDLLQQTPVNAENTFLSKKQCLIALGANLKVLNINLEEAQKIYNWDYDALEFAKEELSSINLQDINASIWEKPNLTEEKINFSPFKFTIEKINSNYLSAESKNCLSFFIPLEGEARLRSDSESPNLRVATGEALLIPAALGRYTLEAKGVFFLFKNFRLRYYFFSPHTSITDFNIKVLKLKFTKP